MQNDIYNAVILIYLPYYQVRVKQLWMESFKKQFALYAAIYAKCLILSLFQYNGMVKIIENYTLHEQIGEGEYGKVYRGVDGRSGKEVAVKVINVKRFKDNPKLQQCTLNQIEVLTKIDSPHIVKFIEILKTINNFYFFYQFCNGGTLDQEIKKTVILSEEKILSFLQQLLEAFKILSANNIMHRDLKPTNILLHNGKIKLGDFGFCKSLQNQRDLAQTMLGSPIYMAPEVLKGQIYTIKADIWSLGVVVYEMCFGFCPFQQSSIARLINVLEYQELQFNKEINPISSQMENFIKKMLIKDHFKRITWEELFAINLKFNTISKQNSNQSNYSHHNRALSEFNRNNRPSDLQYNKEEKLYDNKFMKKKKNAEEEHRNIQNLHENIASVIKLVDKTIESCQNQQLILPLVLRIYKIVLVQHEKLGSKKQFMRERGEISDAIMQVESLMSNDKGLADDFQRLLKNRNKKNANCNQLIAYISNHSINQQNTSAMYLNAKTLQKLLLEAKFLNNSY